MLGSVLAIVDVFVIRIRVLSFILKACYVSDKTAVHYFAFFFMRPSILFAGISTSFLVIFFRLIKAFHGIVPSPPFIFIASASNNWTYYISSRYLFDWYSTSNTLLKIPRFLFSLGIYLPKEKRTFPHTGTEKRNQTKYLPPAMQDKSRKRLNWHCHSKYSEYLNYFDYENILNPTAQAKIGRQSCRLYQYQEIYTDILKCPWVCLHVLCKLEKHWTDFQFFFTVR